MIERGDIRWFRFEAPDKRRPILVLGHPDMLPSLSQILVVPLSSQIRGLPWEVVLDESDGVPTRCTLKLEWTRAVPRAGIGPSIGSLPASRWPEVRKGLLHVTGLALDAAGPRSGQR